MTTKKVTIAYFMATILVSISSINPTNETFQSFLINETYTYNDEYFTASLSDHMIKILCQFQVNLVYVYYTYDSVTSLPEQIIDSLNQCTSITLVRYNNSLPIPMVNDDYVKTVHLNIIKDPEQINLSYIKVNSADKYNSYFLIIFEHEVLEDTWLKNTFKTFWDYHILNVLIVYWTNQLNQMTYSPFSDEFLIKLPPSEHRFKKLFWNKADNLNGHPLKVSLFAEKTRAVFHNNEIISGTDGYLTQVMVKQMNATLVLLPPTDGFDIGEFLKNGSVIGSLAQIVKHEVDVSFNTRFLRLAQFQGKVQITFPNGRDDICILVAKAGYASNIYNIFRAFTKTVWIFTFVSLISASISFAVLYRIQETKRMIKHIFFEFYSWNLAQPINRLPDQWATKILIGFWIIYGLLITSSYQGNLTSNLISRPTLPEINTIKQLEQSSYEVLTFGRYVDLLQNFLNQTGAYNRLKPRIKGVPVQEISKHISENNVHYAYANKYHINQYQSKRKQHIIRGRPVYHNMRECPVPYLVAYAVVYGSPYLGRINTILRRLQESGFIVYWDKQSEGSHTASSTRSDGEPVSLTLDHVQSAFYILFLGCALALVVFLVERIWYRLHKKIVIRQNIRNSDR